MKFIFLNFLWTDEDLPLEYQMGYYSLNNLRMVLQPKSESPSTTTLLPADVSSSGMLPCCFSNVYDALNANTPRCMRRRSITESAFLLTSRRRWFTEFYEPR